MTGPMWIGWTRPKVVSVARALERIPILGLVGDLVEGYLPLVDDYFFCEFMDYQSSVSWLMRCTRYHFVRMVRVVYLVVVVFCMLMIYEIIQSPSASPKFNNLTNSNSRQESCAPLMHTKYNWFTGPRYSLIFFISSSTTLFATTYTTSDQHKCHKEIRYTYFGIFFSLGWSGASAVTGVPLSLVSFTAGGGNGSLFFLSSSFNGAEKELAGRIKISHGPFRAKKAPYNSSLLHPI